MNSSFQGNSNNLLAVVASNFFTLVVCVVFLAHEEDSNLGELCCCSFGSHQPSARPSTRAARVSHQSSVPNTEAQYASQGNKHSHRRWDECVPSELINHTTDGAIFVGLNLMQHAAGGTPG